MGALKARRRRAFALSAATAFALAPSALAYGANLPRVPRAMTVADIVRVRGDFVAAARQAALDTRDLINRYR